MKELSPFELAGYSKEESDDLIKICHKCDIDYNILISALKSFENPIDMKVTMIDGGGSSCMIDGGGSSCIPLGKFATMYLKLEDYLIKIIKKLKGVFY